MYIDIYKCSTTCVTRTFDVQRFSPNGSITLAGVVPIVLYCNTVAKYCNTLVFATSQSIGISIAKSQSVAILIAKFSSIAISIAKSQSVAILIEHFSSIAKSIAKYESIAN